MREILEEEINLLNQKIERLETQNEELADALRRIAASPTNSKTAFKECRQIADKALINTGRWMQRQSYRPTV